jgi:hypothetical protein
MTSERKHDVMHVLISGELSSGGYFSIFHNDDHPDTAISLPRDATPDDLITIAGLVKDLTELINAYEGTLHFCSKGDA